MESIKQTVSSTMGYGDNKDTQSGQEPVSGQTGAGTVNEPYDQGNQYDDPARGGASAQAISRSSVPELPTEEPDLHPASANHGPHPTFAGNLLDPRTGPAAYEETFGQGAPKLEPKSDKYVLGGATTGYGGIEYTTTGRVEGAGSGAVPTGGYETTGASTGGYETGAVSTGGYGSTTVPTSGYEGTTAPTSGYEGTTERSTADYGTTGQFTADYSPTDRGTSNLGMSERSSSNLGPAGRTGGSTTAGDTSIESRESDTLSGSTAAGTTGGGVATQGQPRPEHETDKTGVTSMHSNDPHGSDVFPTERDEDRKNVNVGGFGVVEPSVGANPKSAQRPEQKHQGGDRPMDAPEGGEESAVTQKKDQGEATLQRGDPEDHSGEPMKMHDPMQQGDRSKSLGQPGGGEHGKEKGTGQEYVKSSGLAAEGGDFDATKPGAGREASRLKEERGIGEESDAPTTTTTSSDTGSSGGGIGSKIKSLLGGGS